MSVVVLPLDQTVLLTVDFGISKAGLQGQVGYAIRKSDNTELVARTTTGVFEVTGAPGQFGLTKKFLSTIYSEDAAGYLVVVDTGDEDSALKLVEVIEIAFFENTALVSGTSGAGAGVIYIEDSSV